MNVAHLSTFRYDKFDCFPPYTSSIVILISRVRKCIQDIEMLYKRFDCNQSLSLKCRYTITDETLT